MKRTCRVVPALVLSVSLFASPAAAQLGGVKCDDGEIRTDDLAAMSLESLLNMKVITASKSSETLSTAPGVMSVVSRDELRRFGGITLREVLARVPGLMPTTSYFTDRSVVASRGDQTKINGGHVLMLINGRPTREVLEGGLISDLLESFPLSALERVEVIKGPGSVLYGSNAFSAVVNLITLESKRNAFTVTGLPGTSGAMVTSGQGTFTCGNLSIVGAAQLHRKPDWNTTYRFTDPALDPMAVPVPAAQDIAIRDRSTGAYVGVDYRNIRFMSSFTEWQTAAFVRGTVGENRWRRGFADVGYGLNVREGWDANVNLTYTRNTFLIEQFPNISRDSDEFVAELTNTIKPTDRDQLTVGVLVNRIRGREIYYGLGFPLPISDGTRAGSAAYAQLDHRLVSTVKLIGGFQANKIQDVELDIVPRAGVIWSPARRVNVKALYGQAFRAPSINETGLSHPGLRGTAGLRPEKVATFDLGVGYQGERLQTAVNYFHSKQTDSITVNSAPAVQWFYQNLGEATFQGIELEGKYYVNKQWLLLGSMLRQSNEDGNGTANITPVPNTGVKAGVSYQTSNGLTASAFDVFQAGLPGYAATLNPAPQAYHLVNAELKFDLLKYYRRGSGREFSLMAHGDNLGNEQVWLPDWGGNTGDTIPAMRGRSIYFGIEVR